MQTRSLRRDLSRAALTATVLCFAIAASAGAANAESPVTQAPPAALKVAVGGALSIPGAAVAGVLKKDGGGPVSVVQPRTPLLPAGMPAGVEAASSYVGETSCDPTDKAGAVALGRLLKATYPETSYGVARACQSYMASEHYDGRAVDWMNSVRNPRQAAQATALINWLLKADEQGRPFANARRLGVMYMIWNNKIWESYRASSGWQPYNNCAKTPSPSLDGSCHRNHIHFSLSWEGALKRTSFWTKKVATPDYGPCRVPDLNFAAPYRAVNTTPCPRYAKVSAPKGSSAALVTLYKFSGAYLLPGSNGPAVTAVQKALGVTPATGNFGPATKVAVLKVKYNYRLPATSVMDATTWRVTLRYVAALAAKAKAKATAPKAPTVPKPSTNSLAPYRKTVLQYGAKGAAVSALQRRLGVTPVSGWFGPTTRAVVISWQRYRKLPATGVVDERVWIALGA